MKKRIMLLFMAFVLMVGSSVTVFAGENVGISPRYTDTSLASVSFSIKSGTASTGIVLTPIKGSSMNKVVAAVKIINKDTGATVKSWNQNLTYDMDFENFTATKTTKLSSKGNYYVKVTLKCYKGNSLLETVALTSVTKTY